MADYDDAVKLALRKLRARDRFETEIRADLAGYPEDIVERVVRFLIERKLLDDTRTTQNLIERNTGRRSIGVERLTAELKRRGAPEEALQACVQAASVSEADRIRELLDGRFKATDARSKAARFLIARGFPEDSVESALDRFFQPLPE